MADRKRGTSTSNFGVSRRENHDATAFYDRFPAPVLDTKNVEISSRKGIDEIFGHDARRMDELDDNSVALVVTSPPYFAGKEYEEALGQGHVPETYGEYLRMLHGVFEESVRKLEPGGRIAVNVANLGRKPYRSLSSDVIRLLEEELGLLLRGEIIWVKARGSAGSCAWGSFQRPANPVLRDLTERIVVASKGRFDRAMTARKRHGELLPSESTLFRDEFMEATTDVWEIPPELASRVGHPAPFPVDLPRRLIDLYTYKGDLVLDPFMGSGTTAIAALRTDRHFAGYETDADYVRSANSRIRMEQERLDASRDEPENVRVVLPAIPTPAGGQDDFQARAVREGRAAKDIAELILAACGFEDIVRDVRFSQGVEVNFEAHDKKGQLWRFDVSGGFTSTRPGLRRTDTLWKALGKAAVLHEVDKRPLVLLTTDAPAAGSSGAAALDVVTGRGKPIYDVIELLSPEGQARLARYGNARR